MEIRPEQTADHASIYEINQQAFGRPAEADLVDRLRVGGQLLISLVAVQDDRPVGHVAFSPVTVEAADTVAIEIAGLAPLAVLPELQNQGIGSALVEHGLRACQQTDQAAVVVLGEPVYYRRFGFVPASRFGLRCEYDVPDEAFMAIELRAGVLPAGGGLAKYPPAFNQV